MGNKPKKDNDTIYVRGKKYTYLQLAKRYGISKSMMTEIKYWLGIYVNRLAVFRFIVECPDASSLDRQDALRYLMAAEITSFKEIIEMDLSKPLGMKKHEEETRAVLLQAQFIAIQMIQEAEKEKNKNKNPKRHNPGE